MFPIYMIIQQIKKRKNMPRVSIIIPVYNGMNYVGQSIQSVLEQDYHEFELIVVDDGSSDGLESYVTSISDPVLHYLRQPTNLGAPAALNRGIRESLGELVCWLSHDDLFLPEKLTQQVRFMDTHPEFGMSYTDNEIINGEGRLLSYYKSRWYPPNEMAWRIVSEGNFINGSTVMIRRECFEKAGLFDESMKYVADGEMWFRLLRYYAFGYLQKNLVCYRWHPGNQSHNIPAMRYYEGRLWWRLINLFPVQELLPDMPNHPTLNDLSHAHFLLAQALEKTWRAPGPAAHEYRQSWNKQPSFEAILGYLKMKLYLSPRLGLSNLGYKLLHLREV